MGPTPRDLSRLSGVHPTLAADIVSILNQLPMFVVCGLRTLAEQQADWAKGRTLPGTIVTYKDGITHRSAHQARQDGYGHAVDCAFLGPDPFADSHDWEAYGRLVEARGLLWGGRYKMVDRPHAELA